jgi:hypothetical protein
VHECKPFRESKIYVGKKFVSKKSLSKHTNMGASFEDLVESDLFVKMDFIKLKFYHEKSPKIG